MNKLISLFAYCILFALSVIVFLPKDGLFNLLEEKLQENKIIVSNEKRNDNLFSLNISDANIYYEGINIAKVDNSFVSTFFLFSKVEIFDIKLLDSFAKFVPSSIDKVIIEHSILNYNILKLISNGKFGVLNGTVDLSNRKIEINLEASAQMKSDYSNILNKMTLKDGKYLYEYKF